MKDCAPDCNFDLSMDKVCNSECNTVECNFDFFACTCPLYEAEVPLTLNCRYGMLASIVLSEFDLRILIYNQIIQQNFDVVFDLAAYDEPNSCAISDLQEALDSHLCIDKCNIAEAMYSMGMCAAELPANCTVGWGPEEGQCFECSQSQVQYLGHCADSCPAGTQPVTITSRMCANSTITSTATDPAHLFVLEDGLADAFDGEVYRHFTDALAGVWETHTILWLIGKSATYDINMRFSRQSSNYLTSTSNMFQTTRCLNLTIQSRPCSIEDRAGCIQDRTTLHLHNPETFSFSKKHLTFKNVVLTSRSRFEPSATKYCPRFHQSGEAVLNDRGEIQNYVSPLLLQCSQFANFSLFVLRERARLFLEVTSNQDVRFEDMTLQYQSIVTLERGNLTMTNVDFVNVHLSGGAVILLTKECPFLGKSCSNILYHGGTVAYLNNGFEVQTDIAYGSFLSALNFFSLEITGVVFQYNIASAPLISIRDFKTAEVTNCAFSTNVALGGVLAIEYSWKMDPGLQEMTITNLDFLENFSRATVLQIKFALSSRPVTITNCTFRSNAGRAVAVLYEGVLSSTSISSVNFQDVVFSGNRAFSTLVQVSNYPRVNLASCEFIDNGDSSNDQSVLHSYLNAAGTYAKLEVTPSATQCNSLITVQNCPASLLTNSVLSGNVCKNGGTGIAYAKAGSRHAISNVVFDRNAGTAAAFTAGEMAVLEVWNLTAVDNRLQVVSATGSSHLEVLDSLFQGNQAAHGPLATMRVLNATILRCRFLSNQAQGSDGGAIEATADESSRTTVLGVEDSVFLGNTAQSGGAISLMASIVSVAHFTLVNCSFASNRASVGGSSLSISGVATLSDASYMESCTFTNESSPEGAVSLAFSLGTFVLRRSAFFSNSAVLFLDINQLAKVNLQEVAFLENSAAAIVKVGRKQWAVFRTSDCRFERNLAAVDIQYAEWADLNSLISESSSTAVVLTESQATLQGTKFQRNRSPSLGGAVNMKDIAQLNCTACEFVDNAASLNGGAVYAGSLTAVHLTSTIFLNNSAVSQGSAIYANWAAVGVSSCSFTLNSAGLSATIAGIHATVHLTACTFTANSALLTPGLSVDISSVLRLAGCRFQNQSGQEAAFLTLSTASSAAVANSTFSDGSGLSAVHSTSSFLSMESCNFTETACKDSVFYSSESNVHLRLVVIENANTLGRIVSMFSGELSTDECVFSGYFSGGLFVERASVAIRLSTFFSGSYAVHCIQCSALVIANSSFMSNQDGAVVAESSGLENSEVSISDSVFISNSAQRGGAVYADSVALQVTSTEFVENFAVSGGAAYLTCTYSTECSFSIAQSTFVNNAARVAGGAIAWNSAQPELNSVTFHFNTAQYGPDISSFLARASLAFLDGSSILNGMSPGGRIPKALIVKLYDHYGQPLLLDNSTECEMQPLNESIATITGEKSRTAQQGLIEFTDLMVFANPKAAVLLRVQSAGLIYSSFVELRMRECEAGETELERRCMQCGENSFSIDPSKPCQSCPAHSLCLGNTTVLPRPGYWRSELSSKAASQCRNPSACLGGNLTKAMSFSGFCRTGYEGYMCQACANGYYSLGNFECIKCSWAVPLQGVCVAGAVVLVAFVLAYGAMRKWAGLPFLKILINFFQTLYFVTQLRADWPSAVADLWEGMRRLGAPLDTSMPLDCWLSFYSKTVIYSTLPFSIALTFGLLWLALSFVKRSSGRFWFEAVMAGYFLVYATAARAVFSLFSCTETSQLSFDVREKCWSSEHFKYMLGVGIPCLILCVLAAPFTARVSRLMTQDLNCSFRDWEAVSFLRKAMMAAVCMFFKTSFRAQALALQLIIFGSLIAHYLCWPFNDTLLNRLEFGSLLTVSIVQWCTTAIITVGQSAAWAGPIVTSACVYPCYCVWKSRGKRAPEIEDLICNMRPAKFHFESMKEIHMHYLQTPPQYAELLSGLMSVVEGKVQPALLLSK